MTATNVAAAGVTARPDTIEDEVEKAARGVAQLRARIDHLEHDVATRDEHIANLRRSVTDQQNRHERAHAVIATEVELLRQENAKITAQRDRWMRMATELSTQLSTGANVMLNALEAARAAADAVFDGFDEETERKPASSLAFMRDRSPQT